MPRNPNKTPCGIPGCRAWAIRGSDPPRCSPHRHSKACADPVPRSAVGRSAGGKDTEGTAAEDSSAARSTNSADSLPSPGVGAPPGNQNRLVHGFYSAVLRPQESADLVAYAADTTLDAEIAITRVALRRILGMLLTGHTPGPEPVPLNAQDYARFAGLAFQGAGAISRLLRARQALTPDTDPFQSALYQALDEIAEELGLGLAGD